MKFSTLNKISWFGMGVQTVSTLMLFVGGVYGMAWLGVGAMLIWVYNIRTSSRNMKYE